jgi:hypothetical protein
MPMYGLEEPKRERLPSNVDGANIRRREGVVVVGRAAKRHVAHPGCRPRRKARYPSTVAARMLEPLKASPALVLVFSVPSAAMRPIRSSIRWRSKGNGWGTGGTLACNRQHEVAAIGRTVRSIRAQPTGGQVRLVRVPRSAGQLSGPVRQPGCIHRYGRGIAGEGAAEPSPTRATTARPEGRRGQYRPQEERTTPDKPAGVVVRLSHETSYMEQMG